MKRVLDVDVAFLLRGRVLAASSQLPMLGAAAARSSISTSTRWRRTGGRRRWRSTRAATAIWWSRRRSSVRQQDHKAAYALIVPRPAAGDVRLFDVAGAVDRSEDAAVDAAGADRRRPLAGADLRVRAHARRGDRARSSGWRGTRSRWRAARSRGSTTTSIRALRNGGARDQHDARSARLVAADDGDAAARRRLRRTAPQIRSRHVGRGRSRRRSRRDRSRRSRRGRRRS